MSVTVYTKDLCGYCDMAKATLDRMGIQYEAKKLGTDITREELLEICPNARTMPQIVINNQVIGGYTELIKYIENTGFNGTGHSLG
tara:strand:+ start:20 stop:277 length:258 start_codon:yes stop_codon:yes gene_type:complete